MNLRQRKDDRSWWIVSRGSELGPYPTHADARAARREIHRERANTAPEPIPPAQAEPAKGELFDSRPFIGPSHDDTGTQKLLF